MSDTCDRIMSVLLDSSDIESELNASREEDKGREEGEFEVFMSESNELPDLTSSSNDSIELSVGGEAIDHTWDEGSYCFRDDVVYVRNCESNNATEVWCDESYTSVDRRLGSNSSEGVWCDESYTSVDRRPESNSSDGVWRDDSYTSLDRRLESNSSGGVWCDEESYTRETWVVGGEVTTEECCVGDPIALEQGDDNGTEDELQRHPNDTQGARDLYWDRVVLIGEGRAGGSQPSSLNGRSIQDPGFETLGAEQRLTGEFVRGSRPFVSGQDGCYNLNQDLGQ